ncbi:hypothetical protein [Sulfurimonas indica]|uniref:hypothetical protein n=1 Tax=Sulfurimonas TaxID=202746 RepID=UPI00126454CD|nr:hypothetical protein [Sulfurimonas indica]
MTYNKLIELIKEENTGIAKGYSISFLQDEFSFGKTEEELLALFKEDLAIFKGIENVFLKSKEPMEGDFVEYKKGKLARISRLHKNDDIQLSNKIGVYVSNTGSQASGCTWDPEVDHEKINTSDLIATTRTKKGTCWTFSQNLSGKDRSVYFEIEFKVWSVK